MPGCTRERFNKCCIVALNGTSAEFIFLLPGLLSIYMVSVRIRKPALLKQFCKAVRKCCKQTLLGAVLRRRAGPGVAAAAGRGPGPAGRAPGARSRPLLPGPAAALLAREPLFAGGTRSRARARCRGGPGPVLPPAPGPGVPAAPAVGPNFASRDAAPPAPRR